MKKFIFAWVLTTLALASTVFGQGRVPADSGSAVPRPENPSTDTGKAAIPPPASAPTDTSVVAPEQPRSAADTGAVISQPPGAPADTGAAVPPQNVQPADTGAIPTQPADTASAAPGEKITPAEPDTVSPPPKSIPEEAAQTTSQEEGEARKEPPANRFGMGIVFNDEAPLGIRAWFNPKVGVDVGIGLRGRRVDDLTDSVQPPQRRTTLLDLSFDLGIPIRVIRKEKVDFIIRPGFGFRTRPFFELEPERSVETAVELEVNGSAGIEYFPIERASFSLSAGVALVAERTGGVISNTLLRVESFPKKATNFTFRYYLF